MFPGNTRNQPDQRKSHLTPNQQKLLALMQKVWFGTIRNVPIKNGEPVLAPTIRVTKTIKPEREAEEPEPAGDDCALKLSVMIFFCQLRALDNGTVECIEVRHGLPFLFQIEGVACMFIEDWPQA